MFKCYAKVECISLQADLGETALPATFRAQAEAGPPRAVVVSAWQPDRLTLSASPGGTQTFAREPIAFAAPVAASETVTFLGAFSQARLDRDYVYLVQLWLWQSGDRWLAYYVRRIAQCGSSSDFVFATAYVGTPVSDRIEFLSERGNRNLDTFEIARPAPADDHIEGQVRYNGNPVEALALSRRSMLRSPIFESAPLVSFDATADWLKTVSMGYSMTWQVECPSR